MERCYTSKNLHVNKKLFRFRSKQERSKAHALVKWFVYELTRTITLVFRKNSEFYKLHQFHNQSIKKYIKKYGISFIFSAHLLI